jgi:hypothetical protein
MSLQQFEGAAANGRACDIETAPRDWLLRRIDATCMAVSASRIIVFSRPGRLCTVPNIAGKYLVQQSKAK